MLKIFFKIIKFIIFIIGCHTIGSYIGTYFAYHKYINEIKKISNYQRHINACMKYYLVDKDKDKVNSKLSCIELKDYSSSKKQI